MNVFAVCLDAVLPLFLIMLCGYAVRRAGMINENDVRRLNAVIFRTFMPVMLFESIYSSELEAAVKPELIAFCALAVLAEIGLSLLFVLRTEERRDRQGVMIQALYRSNFALVGLPVAEALMRGGDVSAVAVLLTVVVPIYNVSAVIILESFNGSKVKFSRVLLDVLKNPLIIASVLGLVFVALGLRLPPVIETTMEDMSDAAGPIALFLLGAFFRFEGMGEEKKEIVIACLGRLVVFPAIFLTLGFALGFRGAEFAGLIALFASCTAIASFTMAQQMGGDSRLAGNIVVATSFLCSFTIYLWSVLFMSLGAF